MGRLCRALPRGTPSQIVAGRFTGDAHPDLVSLEDGTLFQRPGLARGGGFGPTSRLPGGWNHLRELIGGQFTGDSRTDLVGIDTESGTQPSKKGQSR